MKRLSLVFGYLTIVSLGASLAGQAPTPAPAPGPPGGRGPAAPTTTSNLQVLPKETTVAQIIPVMQGIAQGLGVGCGYCHVTAQSGAPANDFPADTKPEKNKARVMLRMVQTINTTLGSQLGKPAEAVTRVGCVTCHRGVPIPKQLVDIVTDTGNQGGAAAAITKYRELRKQFYGAQAYDFSDASLFAAAQRANGANKPDDAIAYAQANIEFNPTSARSYQVMSQAYQQKKDTAQAIAAMEKAAQMEPQNAQFQNQLKALKTP